MTAQALDTRQEQAARRSLARSAAYQLLSQVTVYPTEETVAAIREEDLPEAQRAAAELLPAEFSEGLEALSHEMERTDVAELQAQHRKIFTHILSLDCPPCETVYTARHVFEETQELADIGGFFRAFGLEIAERERLDHISVELEFMQFLTFKEAYALLHHGAEKSRFCRQTEKKFMQDHLGRWALTFARKLDEKADGGHFARVASLIGTFVAAEVDFLRAKPDATVANQDWRTKASDDNACPGAEDCSVAELGGRDARGN